MKKNILYSLAATTLLSATLLTGVDRKSVV